ncbi:MAG: hypothetical protein II240_04475 [Bacteroidaceae bacterium]|nr:hypothetical protein [Bacteroidaceae bacterium]
MAARAKKVNNESLITYRVVKAHDGLKEGEIRTRKAGEEADAEYCVSLGLWERITEE